MSAATTAAPCCANSSDDSRPMPLPAPVITATFPASRSCMSSGDIPLNPFEVAAPFPIGHGSRVRGVFGCVEVRVVVDDLIAECGAREGAGAEALVRLLKRRGQAGKMPRRVDVADETVRWLGAAADAVEAGGKRGCESEIGVTIRARKPALDAQALIRSDD